jgi:hypothetical protein
MLFPNQLDQKNWIEAGAEIILPKTNWAIQPQGPKGTDRLLFIVSDSERDFAKAGMLASGPFSSAPPFAARDIELVTITPDNGSVCRDTNTRNLAISQVKKCSTAYGAALLEIEEIE